MSISSLVLLSLGRGLDNYFLVEAPVSVCKAIEILWLWFTLRVHELFYLPYVLIPLQCLSSLVRTACPPSLPPLVYHIPRHVPPTIKSRGEEVVAILNNWKSTQHEVMPVATKYSDIPF